MFWGQRFSELLCPIDGADPLLKIDHLNKKVQYTQDRKIDQMGLRIKAHGFFGFFIRGQDSRRFWQNRPTSISEIDGRDRSPSGPGLVRFIQKWKCLLGYPAE
jgi:hypothetical protein